MNTVPFPERPALRSLVALLSLAMAGACGGGGGGGDTPGSDRPAVRTFWQALEDGAYERIPQVMDELEAAREAERNDAELTLLLAHAHLWRIAEQARDPDLEGAALGRVALDAGDLFEEAQQLAPEDARIAGWLGPVKIRTGQATGNMNLIDEGRRVIAEGIERYPEFNLFSRALVRMDAPADSPQFDEAVQTVWNNLDLCFTNAPTPDMPRWNGDEEPTGPPAERACTNGPKAPHNTAGFWVYAGDIMTKNGDTETARAFYHNAMASPDYPEWRYDALLQQRLDTIEERAGHFGDDNPDNDPTLIGASKHTCTICHAGDRN